MPNYKEHKMGGCVVGALSAGVACWKFGLTPVESGALFIVATVSSLVPDLDHAEARPGNLLKTIIVYLIPLLLYMYLPNKIISTFTLAHWIVLFFISHVLVGNLVLRIIDWCADHRGLFHSLPAAVLSSQLVYAAFLYLPMQKRLVFSIVAFLGYVTHLIMDEIWSLDTKERKIKRSFGTAMDFGNFRSGWTYSLYATIVVLFVVL